MKITRRKVIIFLFGNVMEIKFKVPFIFLIFGFGLPVIAYADWILFREWNYLGYVFVCSLEYILMLIGVFIGNGTLKAIKLKKEKKNGKV